MERNLVKVCNVLVRKGRIVVIKPCVNGQQVVTAPRHSEQIPSPHPGKHIGKIRLVSQHSGCAAVNSHPPLAMFPFGPTGLGRSEATRL